MRHTFYVHFTHTYYVPNIAVEQFALCHTYICAYVLNRVQCTSVFDHVFLAVTNVTFQRVRAKNTGTQLKLQESVVEISS